MELSLQRTLSSATIRNVMKRLEKQGYLQQPHTSAGRLPTDAGYRAYVDNMRRRTALDRWTEPVRGNGLRERGLTGGDLAITAAGPDGVKAMARLLNELTDYVSIILAPSLDTVHAVKVELYPRSQRRVLMVILLDNSQVRTGLLELPEEYSEPVVEQAAQILNRRIRGLTVASIREGRLDSPELVDSPAWRCAAAVGRQGMHLFADTETAEVQMEGVARVLDEPEFRDPEPLKSLLRFIESPRIIRETLVGLDRSTEDGVGVWIGQENPIGDLRAFSLLTGRFSVDGRPGVLAVLGPRRMWYQRALQGLDLVRQAFDH